MADVTFVTADGNATTIDVAPGNSLMLAAVFSNIDGIEGICGGCLSCATCHVYVDEAYADRLPPPSDDELGMLEYTASERKPTSRLGCQVVMTEELAGMVVHLPERQS